MKKVIGIDLGGTKINTIVTDELGKEIYWQTSSTPQGRDAVIEALKEEIRCALPYCSGSTTAIGIGSPGYVNHKTGEIIYSSGVIRNWEKVALKQDLEQTFLLPVIIENDANTAAVGEGWLGSARGINNYVVLTLGTGVGGALVCGEQGVLHGSGWRGGEVGHAILYPNGRLCNCGQRGCVEQYLSGTALAWRFCDLGGQASKASDVFAALANGDQRAMQVRDEFVSDLAVLLISLQSILDPETFLIGGGLIYARQWWWKELHDELDSKSNKGVSIRINPAKLGNRAGAYGAAFLAITYLGEENESNY